MLGSSDSLIIIFKTKAKVFAWRSYNFVYITNKIFVGNPTLPSKFCCRSLLQNFLINSVKYHIFSFSTGEPSYYAKNTTVIIIIIIIIIIIVYNLNWLNWWFS